MRPQEVGSHWLHVEKGHEERELLKYFLPVALFHALDVEKRHEERELLGRLKIIEAFDESMDKSGRDKSCPYKFGVRLEPPENNREKHVKWAKDYEL